jgi:hypothetical protein
MQTTLDQMGKDERTLHLAVAFALADKPAGRIVWVIDQFEEVFTLCSDERRARFIPRQSDLCVVDSRWPVYSAADDASGFLAEVRGLAGSRDAGRGSTVPR